MCYNFAVLLPVSPPRVSSSTVQNLANYLQDEITIWVFDMSIAYGQDKAFSIFIIASNCFYFLCLIWSCDVADYILGAYLQSDSRWHYLLLNVCCTCPFYRLRLLNVKFIEALLGTTIVMLRSVQVTHFMLHASLSESQLMKHRINSQ